MRTWLVGFVFSSSLFHHLLPPIPLSYFCPQIGFFQFSFIYSFPFQLRYIRLLYLSLGWPLFWIVCCIWLLLLFVAFPSFLFCCIRLLFFPYSFPCCIWLSAWAGWLGFFFPVLFFFPAFLHFYLFLCCTCKSVKCHEYVGTC